MSSNGNGNGNIKIDNTYIINLDKDKERLAQTLLECDKAGINNPIKIQGIYGKDLDKDELDKNVEYIYSKIGLRSAIGCAMSHIKAWKTMIKNNDKCALFLEDDVIFSDDFKERIKNIKIPNDYNIIYLGCTTGCDINKKYSLEYPLAKLFLAKGKYSKKVLKINEDIFVPALPLAMHGYLLSRETALYLLNCIEKDKIKHHIDAQILEYIYPINSYSVTPQLVNQRDVNIGTSNNIISTYPVILNKFLTLKDDQGIPLNYKMTIGHYDIYGYIVNSVTGIAILIGIILGLSNIGIKTVSIGFCMFTLLEIIEVLKYTYKIPRQVIVNSFVTYAILILSYTVTSSVMK